MITSVLLVRFPSTSDLDYAKTFLANPVSLPNQTNKKAFERAVLASKSYIIALALVEGYFTTDEAAKAAHVEVQSQIDRWGEVEDSAFPFCFCISLY